MASDPSSATAARKYEWLVVVPDFPGALQKRLEVRSQHFAGLGSLQETGNLKMGGAILNSVPKDDEVSSLDFCGSSLIVIAATREEVVEGLNKDIYAKSGVWDVAKAQMWPLKCAFRNP